MIDDLIKKAIEAKENSYSPYSKFRVGAALITEDDTIFTGCNVENASYGLTICAERNALFKMVSAGYRKFKAIAIVGDIDIFLPPCGACRQVMSEFADKDAKIFMCNKMGEYKEVTMEEILPFSFSL